MNCCQCGKKLNLFANIKGNGTCSYCGTEQAIKKSHTFIMVIALIITIAVLPFDVAIKITLVVLISVIYLFFSKTEKTNKDK